MASSPCFFKQTTKVPLNTNSVGDFRIGLNFNGCPNGAGITTSIICYTQDSLLFPYTYADFANFSSLATLWSQMRCAGLKIKYIPMHTNDDSAIALWPIMYWQTDRDGVEQPMNTINELDYFEVPSLKTKVLNRVWKIWRKPAKYPLKTKIPSISPSAAVNNNQNIWGQWHGVGDSLGGTYNSFGSHIAGLVSGATHSFLYGQLVITGYFVLKDRL